MAVTFSKHGGLNDEAWKVIDTELSMVIQDTDTEKNNDDELVKALFNVKTSKKFGEKQGSMTEFGNFEEVTEGDNGIADDFGMGFSKLIEHHQFIKTFTCTREARDDGDIDMMKQTAANFVRAYKRSRAQFATAALTAEGASFVYGDKTYDKTTGDGKALFAQDHLGKKSGVGTQTNVFTDAIWTNVGSGGTPNSNVLMKAANRARNFKNQSGFAQGYTFDTIIIPGNCPEMEDGLKRIIRSDGLVGSDYNDVNTQKGLWKLIVNNRWEAAAGTNPWIIMSSEAQRELNAGAFFDRVALDVSNEVLNKSRNLEWSGYARWGAGFFDWRAYLMGGAQVGSTL